MREGFRVIRVSEKPDGYTCRICEKSHKDEDEALDCCEPVAYACPVCEEIYSDEDSAKSCCDRIRNGTGEELRVYQCNWCFRKHLAQEPAEKCCPVRNYKCSSCGEKFTIEQFKSKEICSCERSVHQVILF